MGANVYVCILYIHSIQKNVVSTHNKVIQNLAVSRLVMMHHQRTLFRNERFMLNEMIQRNSLPYFWNQKSLVLYVLTQFVFSFCGTLSFSLMNSLCGLCHCQHTPGHLLGIELNTKKLSGFSYSKSIANFEAFQWNILSSINFLFLQSQNQAAAVSVPAASLLVKSFCSS